MRKILKSLLIFAAGLFVGLALAQALIILYNRDGGSFGGELFVVWMIPGLIYVGYTIAKDIRIHIARSKIFQQGYDEGFKEASKRMPPYIAHPNCGHTITPYRKEESK